MNFANNYTEGQANPTGLGLLEETVPIITLGGMMLTSSNPFLNIQSPLTPLEEGGLDGGITEQRVTSSSSLLVPSPLPSSSSPSPTGEVEEGWMIGLDVLVLVLKGLVMSTVILASVLGNLLVIVSVAR